MAYSINLAHDKKVITIPLSVFFTPENRHKGENLVRIAFCKKPTTIDKAFDNLKI
jgi:aspartate/methionine/tyrosine aminotransferase